MGTGGVSAPQNCSGNDPGVSPEVSSEPGMGRTHGPGCASVGDMEGNKDRMGRGHALGIGFSAVSREGQRDKDGAGLSPPGPPGWTEAQRCPPG